MTGKHAAPSQAADAVERPDGSSIFLQRVHMAAFGRFVDRAIGPFEPGLNVVYGANEAGKTTARAFIGGVLFGWPEARGMRNAYKPRAAEREGSLLFFDQRRGELGNISRAKNAEGLLGDDEWIDAVCGDIDRETFQTLFSLDADELRSLEAAPDISSKLLTAGSGTRESPARVASGLDGKIAAYTSRAAAEAESFPNLRGELERVKLRLSEARAAASELKDEDIELQSLLEERERVQRRLSHAHARIEAVASCRGELERIDASSRRLSQDVAQAKADMRTCELDAKAELAAYEATPRISAEAEASLRSAIAPLAQQEDSVAHRVDSARMAYEQARGMWQAQCDAAEQHGHGASGKPSRALPGAALCLAAACAVVAFALAVFVPQALPVAFTSMVVAACFAVVGVVALLRAKPDAPSARTDVDSARAAMVACKSTLDSREGEAMALADHVRGMLASVNFPTRATNARDALRDLDAMNAARAADARVEQAKGHARLRRDKAAEDLERLVAHRAQCLAAAGLDDSATLEDIEAAASSVARVRDDCDAALARMNSRIGQLRQILSDGERETELDLLKTQRAQIVTRQNESAEDLARLLLAHRMVAGAIDAWGTESQPEVYAKASHLMSLMTSGAWTGVSIDGSDVCAVDSFGARFAPRFLSLGTCQQLYLALRIALLECVPEVGRAIPVLCDDILVNFDDGRRAGAARALAELAQTRQVIVFICHKEVVSTFTEQSKHMHVLEL